jgi:hypothetical protein
MMKLDRAGDVMFREGTPCDAMIFIISGEVSAVISPLTFAMCSRILARKSFASNDTTRRFLEMLWIQVFDVSDTEDIGKTSHSPASGPVLKLRGIDHLQHQVCSILGPSHFRGRDA